MNITSRLITFGLTILSLAVINGCSKARTEQPTEKSTIQGRWSGFERGSTERITLALTGDRFAYWDSQTNEIGSGTFVVNDAVQPTQIDLTFEKIGSSEYVGKVGLAIYELRGNELTFAGSEPGSTVRPTNIAGGQGIRVFAFKRE